jgi:hypothetical protein
VTVICKFYCCLFLELLLFQCILFTPESCCPALNCEQTVDNDRREWFQAIWDKQFKVYKESDVSVFEKGSDELSVVHITVLNGDAAEIDFYESWTITRLMTEIKKALKFDINEQRLLYSGKELSVSTLYVNV